MAFDPRLEQGEEIAFAIHVPHEGRDLTLLLTNRGAWWARSKAVAVSDPIATEFVPLRAIREVSITRCSRLMEVLVAVAIILVGVGVTVGSLMDASTQTFAGWGLVLGLCGALILVYYPVRRRIAITSDALTISWAPALLSVSRPTRLIGHAEDAVRTWARAEGLPFREG